MAKKNGRAVGDGSLYPRRLKGEIIVWIAAVELERVDGKRRQRRVLASTKTKAAEKLRELQAQVSNRLNIDPDNQTVAELLDRWMEIERRPKTQQTYEIAIRLRLKPYLGRMKVQLLRADHVQSMVTTLQKHGDGKRAIELAVAVLSRCLNWAIRIDELQKKCCAVHHHTTLGQAQGCCVDT
jgi:hypothetical protein